MEIIRRATIEEMMTLEEITLKSDSLITNIFIGGIALLVIAFMVNLMHESTPVFVGSMLSILIATLSLAFYVEGQLVPEEQAAYEDHPYLLAIIDNSDNFEHESYRLVEHHKDNTYFVEAIQEDESQ